MKATSQKRLFWFLRDDAELDLTEPSVLDMYVQQVLARGGTDDIKGLLKDVAPENFRESFARIKQFLPSEVRMFWEDFLGSNQ